MRRSPSREARPPRLTGSDYELEYTGATWSLKRLDTGVPVALAGTGTALDPLRADGLSMVVSGTPAAGDRVLVRPSRDAVAGFDLRVSDPSRIAAAAPIVASASAANTGSARSLAAKCSTRRTPSCARA
jgi:flagellar hook-associated protein 1